MLDDKGVLAKIYQIVMTKEKAKVLDIGFGTLSRKSGRRMG